MDAAALCSAAGVSAALGLALAEGISPKLIRASRYLQGALLAPVFYPDDEEVGIGQFTTSFARAHDRLPLVQEALAYAAVLRAQGITPPEWPEIYVVQGTQIRPKTFLSQSSLKPR